MEYLLEIMKIVEGGLKSDRERVRAYAEQLVTRLKADGNTAEAERIERVLGQSKMRNLGLSRASAHQRVPLDSETKLTLADEKVFTENETPVFLDTAVRDAVDQFVKFTKAADQLLAHGVPVSPSLIVYGPPGCGKTRLVCHIAARLELPLITARMDGLVSSYLGSTSKNLRVMFEYAMNHPSVLFLDDFDAVAKLRDDNHELGELKRVVVSLLQNIDALDGHTVLLAATNHSHLLDPAIWRRFSYRIHLDKPTHQVRVALFRHFLESHNTSEDIELFAALAEGLTGSDIQEISHDARRLAILSNERKISARQIMERIVDYKAPAEGFKESSLAVRLKNIRDMNPKLFTYRKLSELFGVSVGQISKLLRKEE